MNLQESGEITGHPITGLCGGPPRGERFFYPAIRLVGISLPKNAQELILSNIHIDPKCEDRSHGENDFGPHYISLQRSRLASFDRPVRLSFQHRVSHRPEPPPRGVCSENPPSERPATAPLGRSIADSIPSSVPIIRAMGAPPVRRKPRVLSAEAARCRFQSKILDHAEIALADGRLAHPALGRRT